MSDTFLQILILTGLSGILVAAYQMQKRRRQLRFIETYQWPQGLLDKLKAHHPNLTHQDLTAVSLGLKQFFRAYLRGGRRNVAMPSQIADDLWHEFILYTRAYHRFCDQAFGRYLHHTPAVALRHNQKHDNEGLRRVWWQACREEGIDVRAPKSLPLLFTLDASLRIPGGYHYTPDCDQLRRRGVAGTQCGGDMSSSSFDGGTSGLGDGDGSGGDGGGDGGGGGCGGD